MKRITTVLGSLLLVATATAQTQLVRGDVDTINQTNRFRLDCTSIELVSTTVNLQALHDQSRQQNIEYEMQVTVVRTAPTVLNVVSATVIPEIFDMGNLRLGRADRWHVLGTPGSMAAVFLTGESMTSYSPFGPLGTWVLGNTFLLINQGQVSALGRFEFNFQPPNIPGLVGASFTGQALVRDPNGAILITNPHCKEVRAN